jgi:hypothetical protein
MHLLYDEGVPLWRREGINIIEVFLGTSPPSPSTYSLKVRKQRDVNPLMELSARSTR